MYKTVIIAIAVLFFHTGCGTEAKEAQKRLDKAKALYENHQFLDAKSVIDSIHVLFPREVAARREALALMRLVERGENERNMAYCDSMLPLRISELEKLKKGFIFEKDPVYDVSGKYIFPAMAVERNIGRSYIRCGVDEEGEMYIASVYYGSAPLNHTGLTFSTNDGTHASTPSIPYDGGINYRFKDMGNTTEVVTYKGNNCKEIANFLMIINEKERVKATYTGGKAFSLYLSDNDKKAIRATYELANTLSEITALRKEKNRSEKKIRIIDEKIN